MEMFDVKLLREGEDERVANGGRGVYNIATEDERTIMESGETVEIVWIDSTFGNGNDCTDVGVYDIDGNTGTGWDVP